MARTRLAAASRPLRVAAAAGALALVTATLAGCASDSENAAANPNPSPTPSAEPTPDGPTVERNAYPVTVKHKWGETRIEKFPERVVTIGDRTHAQTMALGVTPVAVHYVGEQPDTPYGQWPWVPDDVADEPFELIGPTADGNSDSDEEADASQDAQADSEPDVGVTERETALVPDAIDYEAIEQADPDLILALWSNLQRDGYERLSEIAPTIMPVSADGRDFFSSWQEEITALGDALGRPTYAEELIENTEQLFSDVRDDHPELNESKVAVAVPGPAGRFELINPFAPLARFFTSLGLEFPDRIADITGPKNIYELELGYGSFNLFSDVDAVIWLVGDNQQDEIEAIKNNATYTSLPAVRKDNDVYLSGAVDDALYFSTPRSLPYALDKAVPEIVDALDERRAVIERRFGDDEAVPGDKEDDAEPSATASEAPTREPSPEATAEPNDEPTAGRSDDPAAEPGDETDASTDTDSTGDSTGDSTDSTGDSADSTGDSTDSTADPDNTGDSTDTTGDSTDTSTDDGSDSDNGDAADSTDTTDTTGDSTDSTDSTGDSTDSTGDTGDSTDSSTDDGSDSGSPDSGSPDPDDTDPADAGDPGAAG